MVIVFDLDDTLYEEKSFVFSGFQAVARELSLVLSTDAEEIAAELKKEFAHKRTQVFDRYLAKKGKKTQRLIAHCLRIYRSHDPQISLFPEAKECLNRLKHRPLYVVTDGHRLVQKRKFIALGLNRWIKRCLCTYAFGLRFQKPSPHCFQKISKWEGVAPNQVVYIADNPYKDFVGIKPLGFVTVRVLTGPYRSVVIPGDFNAKVSIKNLRELDENFLNNLL